MDSRFISYQVNDNLHLLTPIQCFWQVDQPYWSRMEQVTSSSIHIQQIREWTSLFEAERYGTFSSLTQRRNIYVEYGSAYVFPNQVFAGFEGRATLLTEVKTSLTKKGFNIENILETLQLSYLQGFFSWKSPIGYRSYPRFSFSVLNQFIPEGRAFCHRCGLGRDDEGGAVRSLIKHSFSSQVIQVECRICGSESCYYCPQCLHLGLSKACEPYLEWDSNLKIDSDSVSLSERVVFHWQGQLSLQQEEAAQRLYDYIYVDHLLEERKPFLIWAVCGAGKTEILFPTIYEALRRNQKILITSPRRDVIVELAPRIQSAFPMTKVVVLHADEQDKFQAGELFLATTHQTLRFVAYFDLIIVDEVDAFPYHNDPMLPEAVKKSKKPGGNLVYLSATPRKEMLTEVKKGYLPCVRVVQRYHGYPLAIPQLIPIGPWRKYVQKGVIISELVDYIVHLYQRNRVGYLFIATVKDLPLIQEYITEIILPYLRAKYPAILNEFIVETVHAEDPRRAEIVQKYRAHQISLLVTTTILERGVTIAYSDVAVLGSDESVFDVASLIQMAGRTGRKQEDPVGNVWFFPEVRTNNQIEAIGMIQECNELAQKEGGKLHV